MRCGLVAARSCASSAGSRTRWCAARATRASPASPGTKPSGSLPTASARARPNGSPSTSPRGASPTRPTTSRRRSPDSWAPTTSTTRRGSATRRRPTTLKRAIGVGATTCSYTDVIESNLIVLFGANVANAQPVFMKYLYLARKRGAKVAVVNPMREPGLDRYWVPSNVESAMFGTKMTDEFFAVNTGGDVAFLNGVLKVLLADGGIDREFVREHTEGFDALEAVLQARVLRRPRTAIGCNPRRHGAVRHACTRPLAPRCSCGRWGSPSTSTAPTTSPPSSTSGSRAATSAGAARASCPSAATPACRAVPRWARTRLRSPVASPSRPSRRHPSPSSTGSRSATEPGSPPKR